MEQENNTISTMENRPMESKEKMSKKAIVCMVILTVVALAGVAFGVWGVSEKNQAEKDLNKITETSDEATEIVTDEVTNIDEDGVITEIADTNTVNFRNPIVQSGSSEVYVINYSKEIWFNPDPSIAPESIYIVVRDGKIERSSVSGADRAISGLNGNIYKIVELFEGQWAGETKVGFIMEDGTVYYIASYDGANLIAQKVKIDGFVKDVVGINYCPGQNTTCFSSTVFVMGDNSIVKYSKEML